MIPCIQSDFSGVSTARSILSSSKRAIINTPLQPFAENFIKRPISQLRALKTPHLRHRIKLEKLFDKAFADLLQPDAHYIDIGAHIGSVLAHFVRAAPNGAHIAFEPTPEKAAFLKKKFPTVQIQPLALAEQSGEAEFFVNAKRPGFNSMIKRDEGFGKTETIKVCVGTLDNILPTDRKFSVVKIDVEGLELNVLKGGTKFLARDRPIIVFECGPALPNEDNEIFGDDLFLYITEELGYDVMGPEGLASDGAPLTLEEFRQHRIFPFTGFDFIAKPRL